MTEVLTIRPAPGDARTVALGREMGLAVVSHPLFAVEPLAWDVPEATDLDALMLGSANALRHGGAGLGALTDLPAFCVGETTAEAARDAGFTVIGVGAGGLQSVIPMAQELGFKCLLRLSGEAHVPLDLPPHMTIVDRTLYRVAAHRMTDALATALNLGPVVLLHSGEAAAHFACEVDRRGFARSTISLACLAPRIAIMVGTGWRRLSTTEKPDDRALLALAAQMCQA